MIGIGCGLTKEKTAGPGVPVNDPYFSSVVLLMGLNGADASTTLTDDTGRHTFTVSGDALTTAVKKFGTASLHSPNGGTYSQSADSVDWYFPGQFTIELWHRSNLSAVQPNQVLIEQWPGTNPNSTFSLRYAWSSSVLKNYFFQITANGNPGTPTTLTQPQANIDQSVFHFITVDRDASNVVRLYVDGVMVASATLAGGVDGAGALNLGYVGEEWIDEVRVTKGVARYASNAGFTPPTAAFPRQ